MNRQFQLKMLRKEERSFALKVKNQRAVSAVLMERREHFKSDSPTGKTVYNLIHNLKRKVPF